MKHNEDLINVLILGGCGFIGSNLCRYLLSMPHYQITCMDNFCTGNSNNIKELLENPKFECIEGDVCDFNILHSIIRQLKPQWVFNLACPASPPQYQKIPLETLDTCYVGTKNLLELEKEYKFKMLQASTSEVYGDPVVHPQNERYFGNTRCNGPRSCYDEGKRVAESLIYNYKELYGVDCRVIRIFNTYGPYLNPKDGRVVSNFIMQALKDEPLTIYGDGSQTRSFMYISDLLRGMLLIMEQLSQKDNMNETFEELPTMNLGNPHEITIKELAETILKLIPKSKSTIVYKELPINDPHRRCPDIGLAQKKLGWSPQVSLEDGLRETVEYFKNIN